VDPTPDLIDQLSDALVRSARRLRRNERKELAPFGLTFGQARALRLLAANGDGMRIGELAAALEIIPRAATSMVDALEGAGLVARRADPADRRSVIVGCSAQGTALLGRLAEERRTAAEGLFAPLSPAEREELLRLLRATAEVRTTTEVRAATGARATSEVLP
jgi:DNA-binding MarR family transcriptional regulator